MGTALNIKPILHFEEGKIKPHSQARTKRKALTKLLDIVEERLDGKKMHEACIMDMNIPDEGELVTEMVRDRFNPPLLYRSGVSPVVGTHVGPSTVGIAFYAVN